MFAPSPPWAFAGATPPDGSEQREPVPSLRRHLMSRHPRDGVACDPPCRRRLTMPFSRGGTRKCTTKCTRGEFFSRQRIDSTEFCRFVTGSPTLSAILPFGLPPGSRTSRDGVAIERVAGPTRMVRHGAEWRNDGRKDRGKRPDLPTDRLQQARISCRLRRSLLRCMKCFIFNRYSSMVAMSRMLK